MKRKHKFEVVVAGGGPAGVSAAVAAARSGANVLLIERDAGLGGNVRAAHVHSICGLYRISQASKPVPLNGGIGMEVVSRLEANCGSSGPHRFGKVDIVLQEPEVFAGVCAAMAESTDGLEVATATSLERVFTEAGRIHGIEVCTESGKKEIEAAAFVDCTGDASLGALAGVASGISEPAKLQRPAFIFALDHVDDHVLDAERRLTASARIVEAVRSGKLPVELLQSVLRPTCRRGIVRVTIDLDAGGADYDPLSQEQIRELTLHGQNLAKLFLDYIRSAIEGFQNARLHSQGERIGIRESRRLVGQKTISAQDVLCGNQPDDTVALACWPMEYHEAGQSMRLVFPKNDSPYGIPLGALRSMDIENLLVAGRCLSATREAQASARVIGCALASGQASGLAACYVANGEKPDINTIKNSCMA